MEIKNFICPICGSKFKLQGKSILCEKKHNFDIAKEGYVNLLPVNDKHSKNPGDDKLMIEARDKFLKLGFFDNLRQEIYKIILKQVRKNGLILDAGCGTGYYIENLVNSNFSVLGVDISKDAIKIASKNNKNASFAVASIFKLPVQDESVDCILNIFAPKPNEEFRIVLKPDGIIIEVVPGEDHLKELKELLYDKTRNRMAEYKEFDLDLTDLTELKYQKNLNKNQLLSLYEMTPYYYTTDKSKIDKFASVDKMNVTFDFKIKTWKKN